MIEVTHLTKNYGRCAAISDMNFKIDDGEIIGLLGLNGAGKSTILRILSCSLLPTRGDVIINGSSVISDPDNIRKKIGYLPDVPPLYNEMTVLSYLRFAARLRDVPQTSLARQVDKAMDATQLEGVKKTRLGELSHGFRQRVGIAQALVHEPEILILDEPINGLDPIQIVEMRDLIVSFRGRYTVILSSHILSEITRTCDRILVLDKGKKIAEGAETTLQKELSKGARLICLTDEYRASLRESLEKLPGVTQVDGKEDPQGYEWSLNCEGDMRAQVAQIIVKSGVGLLGLSEQDTGLESLFVKLIESSSH